ncbi:MAG: DNA methyltransferase, partial [Polyangiaceae bacterium]
MNRRRLDVQAASLFSGWMLAPAHLTAKPLGRLEHLSFKGNLKETRYGWLRLTPAYSVHLVGEILEAFHRRGDVVLDPFCGTGTTALVCAERGVEADTTDINPFLLWLARTKTATYTPKHAQTFREQSAHIGRVIGRPGDPPWVPPLHQIEKWWTPATLDALGRVMGAIRKAETSMPSDVVDLLKIAFCRVMIERANVSFGHQSMSFKKVDATLSLPLTSAYQDELGLAWERAAFSISGASSSGILAAPSPILCDARDLRTSLQCDRYGLVITSPPYPNRMSYIRELRPYMYWLGYLDDGRQAGELDWKAIGGTWGCATSNVAKWKPERPIQVPYNGFAQIVANISATSPILGPYVAKY